MHVVIPAAGKGTRLAPYTQTVPKELVPVLMQPALSYILDECNQAGITDLTVISSPDKPLVQEYLAHARTHATIVIQERARGLGDAILCAQPHIQEDFFGICLPDDLIIAHEPLIGTLKKISEQYQASVIAVQEVPRSQVQSYGIVTLDTQISDTIFAISDIIEKPAPDKAPSCYGVIGRYWLSSRIFPALHSLSAGAQGELQLTDAIKQLITNGERVLVYVCKDIRHDTGTPLGWLTTNIDYALRDEHLRQPLLSYLHRIVSQQ